MRYAAAVLLAALATAAPASAQFTPGQLRTLLQVADSHFPNSPCYHQHELHWTTGAQLDQQFPALAGSVAIGLHGACEDWLATDRLATTTSTRMNLAYTCTVLAHEYGHNAGLDHSTVPGDVMNAPIVAITAPCWTAFVAPRRLRVRWARGWR
jgi:hypothetical protein